MATAILVMTRRGTTGTSTTTGFATSRRGATRLHKSTVSCRRSPSSTLVATPIPFSKHARAESWPLYCRPSLWEQCSCSTGLFSRR